MIISGHTLFKLFDISDRMAYFRGREVGSRRWTEATSLPYKEAGNHRIFQREIPHGPMTCPAMLIALHVPPYGHTDTKNTYYLPLSRGSGELRRASSPWRRWLGEPQPWCHQEEDKKAERSKTVQHFAIAPVG